MSNRLSSAAVYSALVGLFFFLSGMTGLTYELIWFKRFTHVWGSSAMAMAVVVSAFLAGLGIGAAIFGRLADRITNPLRWYGFADIGIAVMAILIPLLMSVAQGINTLFPTMTGPHPLAQTAIRFVATLVVIGPACILMGATLPLLVKHSTSAKLPCGKATGWLYGVNTLGAAMGCFLAGFFVLPALGLHRTNLLAAAVNFVVGLGAIALSAKSKPVAEVATGTDEPAEEQRPSLVTQPRPINQPLYFAFCCTVALTGCAAIGMQMIWARQLSLILGGSTYAFAAALFAVLVGIGGGSLLYRMLPARATGSQDGAVTALIIAVFVLAASAVIGKQAVPGLCLVAGGIRHLRVTYGFNALFSAFAAAILQLVPCLIMGFIFPLVIGYADRTASRVGRLVGSLYAWNIVGSIVGGILTSAFLVPQLGIDWAVAVLVGCYVLATLCLMPWREPWHLAANAGVTLAGLGLVVWCGFDAADPRVQNYGAYMYGMPPQADLAKADVTFFKSGPSANVFVLDAEDALTMRMNGKIEASDKGDMPSQLGSAYFPLFLRPDAKDVLVIGYGSGTTVGAALVFGPESIVCCEIEPNVIEAGKLFSHVNHRPDKADRVEIIYDDARNYIQAANRKFDIVISEPSNPWLAGIGNLFTTEFYETVSETLNDGGILAQWVQMYSMSPTEYRMILRTIQTQFNYTGIVRIGAADTLLLAANEPLEFTGGELDRLQARVDGLSEVRNDLATHLGTSDVRSLLLNQYVLGHDEVWDLAREGKSRAINTDINMRLEYDTPTFIFRKDVRPEDTVEASLDKFMSFDRLVDRFRRWGCGPTQVKDLKGTYNTLVAAKRFNDALKLAQFAIDQQADNSFFQIEHAYLTALTGSSGWVDTTFKRISDPDMINRIGVRVFKGGRAQLASSLYERLVQIQPNSSTIWTNYATLLRQMGKSVESKRALEKAIELDPSNDFALRAQRSWGAATSPE